MLIDKVRKLVENINLYKSEMDKNFQVAIDQNDVLEMAQALIAVDGVLRCGYIHSQDNRPLNKFAQGNNAALTEVSEAMESMELNDER